MIVSKFSTSAEAEAFGLEIAQMLDLKTNDDGRYETSWGNKSAEGLGRCFERMYRERVYGKDEQITQEMNRQKVETLDAIWPKR